MASKSSENENRPTAEHSTSNRLRLYASLPLAERQFRLLSLQPSEVDSQRLVATLTVQDLPQRRLPGYLAANGWIYQESDHGGCWQSPDGKQFARPIVYTSGGDYSYTQQNQYEALSYVWGQSNSGHTIEVNGLLVRLGDNLYHALRHIRSERRPRTLWIDAICIDQENDQEKTLQVAMMSTIYSASWRAIIWLGEDNEMQDGRPILDFWEWVASRFDIPYFESFPLDWVLAQARGELGLPNDLGALHSQGKNRAPEDVMLYRDTFRWPSRTEMRNDVFHDIVPRVDSIDIDNSHLERFLRRPWFDRRWVLQEFSLAPFKLMQIGPYSTEWTTHHTRILSKFTVPPSSGFGSAASAMRRGLQALTMMPDSGPDAVEDLWRELQAFDNNCCFDDRDRLAAFHWRIRQAMVYDCPYRTDYAISTEHNYKAFATAVLTYSSDTKGPSGQRNSRGPWTEIRSNLLRGLLLAAACRQKGRKSSALPSWVPDWRVPTVRLFQGRMTTGMNYAAIPKQITEEEAALIAALQPHLQLRRVTFVAWLPKDDTPMASGNTLELTCRTLATFAVLTSKPSIANQDVIMLIREDERHDDGYRAMDPFIFVVLRSTTEIQDAYELVDVDPQFYFETDEGLKRDRQIQKSADSTDILALWAYLAKYGDLQYVENERREYRKSGVLVRKLACYRSHAQSIKIRIV